MPQTKVPELQIPDPIKADGTSAITKPSIYDSEGNSRLHIEGKYVIVPMDVWEQYYRNDDELIMDMWYWKNITSFLIDYKASVRRQNKLEGDSK